MTVDTGRVRAIARYDLRQLLRSRDFLVPMATLGALFFVILPVLLLVSIEAIGRIGSVGAFSDALDALPAHAQKELRGDDEASRTQFALAVYLFAPLAIIVPLTISSAVGASSFVAERERGTGEFLAHSPATTEELYLGKLVASLIPGYLTTLLGFALYSLAVNILVGPSVGGWFFPTADWVLLMGWVVPPFLLGAQTLVVRLSARVRSTAAAQQASGLITLPLILVAYSQSTGTLFGAARGTALIGVVGWVAALISLRFGMRSMVRERLLGVGQ